MKLKEGISIESQIKNIRRSGRKVVNKALVKDKETKTEVINTPVNDNWQKVNVAEPWKPEPGEVIEGLYAGCLPKTGMRGMYQAHYIKTESGTKIVSGVLFDNLISAAAVEPKTRIKVVYKGRTTTAYQKPGSRYKKEYKEYDLYVG